MSQERMQSVKEGEVESDLRGGRMEQQKLASDQPPVIQQPQDAQRFTNMGGQSSGVGQQQSSLGQQGGQVPIGAQQQPQTLSSNVPQGAQQQGGVQQPISSQTQQLLQQGIGSQPQQYNQQMLGGQQPALQQGTGQQVGVSQQGPSVATFSEIAIDDPAYEPQMRIANMQDSQRAAFLKPYRLTRFADQPLRGNDITPTTLIRLESAAAARVVCFPIPRSPSVVDDQSKLTGDQQGLSHSSQQPISGPSQQGQQLQIPVQQGTVQSQQSLQHPIAPQQQQQGIQQQQLQQGISQGVAQGQQGFSQGVGQGQPGLTTQGVQLSPYQKSTVVNTMGLEIEATSQVWELIPPVNELGPGCWDAMAKTKGLFIKGSIGMGPLLFLNTSQIPSSSSRTSPTYSLIDKPARHLFVFGASSDAPVLVVERDLKPLRKFVKVFSSDMRVFCKIEGTTSFLRKKIVITGPDEDTPIYTVKQKGFSGPFKGFSSIGGGGDAGVDAHYMIYKNKRPIGCITSRYLSANTLPGAMLSSGHNENMGYDVFFPHGAEWAHKAALLITALYFDYLWSDKIE